MGDYKPPTLASLHVDSTHSHLLCMRCENVNAVVKLALILNPSLRYSIVMSLISSWLLLYLSLYGRLGARSDYSTTSLSLMM